MAAQTALIIGIPLILEALSEKLNKPLDLLQSHFDTNSAFRNYVINLQNELTQDMKADQMNYTPSTMPRFDSVWVQDELNKRQKELFDIKTQLAEIDIKAHQSAQETYNDSPEKKTADWKRFNTVNKGLLAIFDPDTYKKDTSKRDFLARKARESNQYAYESAKLKGESQSIKDRPLVNNNITYQKLQERKRNAQISKVQQQKKD